MVEITPMTVMALHQVAMEASNDQPQWIRDEGALESALARPHFLRAYGKNDPIELNVSVAAALVQNHAFVDGNKRTAWQVLAWLIHANGFDLDPPSAQKCVEMMSGLASHTISEIKFVSWYRRIVVQR